ncbi:MULTISPECIES: TonB-dependent receptor plug domain-containing protein [Sphingomonas]|uniref:TonB-dependent receptor plug domain-containing protein n=1 Tax=Sphingomonas TaxID=13687 RepID=UPI000830B47A|nr:TonB-dependent receptor [Sphingomonas sp. CCH10-B3]
MNRLTLLSLSPLFAATAPAWAQTATPAQSVAGLQDATTRESVVVTANRTAQPLDRIGQSVTVIDREEIRRRQSSVVADLLRQTPGVTISRNGGVGTNTSVNIRGAETDQTVALIDGIKLNDPSSPGGGFNFGPLLIGNIDRVEVVRGAQSVLWGSQAIGGVVNLITRQPTATLKLNGRAEGGSFATGQAFANASGKAGPLALSVGGGWFESEGISAAASGREADGYRNYAANGSATLTLTRDVSVDLRGFYADSRTDIDGFVGSALGDTPEYSLTRQALGYAGLNVTLFDGKFRNRLGYALTDTRRRNENPALASPETFRGVGRNARIEYQGVVDVGPMSATFGVEHEVSRFTSSSNGGAAVRGRTQIDSIYGQILLTPMTGLTLTGGVRYDDHNLFGGVTTASASGVWSPNAGATTLRASYSEGFKAPTLFQLQSEFGNALLRPERSRGLDVGITQRLLAGAITAEATWFRRDSRDLIVFVSCPRPLTGICVGRPSGTYDNITRATAEGLEAGLTLRPSAALRVTASYTYLRAINETPGASFGARLARRPSQSLTLLADYRWKFGLETGATVTQIGSSFDNASNTRRLAGYTLVDLRASIPLNRQIALYGRIENLFDERYETIFQYAQPGRAAYGGVRVGF